MNKTKQKLSILMIIILSFIILFVYFYTFKEAKKMTADQATTSKNLADLEAAKQKVDFEKKRLNDLKSKSYAVQVSKEQYLKIKSLVDETNIFFKNANSLHPQIQIKIKDKALEDKINAKRVKINELLLTWEENNKSSMETSQSLINQIKIALLYIQSYVDQIHAIVFGLSAEDSGLSNEQINSYKKVITESVSGIKEIITTVNIADTIIREESKNNPETETNITKQIEVVRQAENNLANLEKNIDNTVAATTPKISQDNTNPVSSTTSNTNTSGGIKVNSRPRIVNPAPAIIYQQNPAPYKNTGVDVNTSGQMSPLQDW